MKRRITCGRGAGGNGRVSAAPESAEEALRHTAPSAVRDFRHLEAPEPLERVLLALADASPGEVLVARTPRVPAMLFPQLEARGVTYRAFEEPDGSGLVWMRKPAD